MADLGLVGKFRRVSYYAVDRLAGSGVPVNGKPVRLYAIAVYKLTIPDSTLINKRIGRPVRIEAVWAQSEQYPLLFYTASGNIRGTIKQDGVILPNCLVAVYYRKTLQLVASQYSKSDGTFRFDNLIQATPDFFVVAFDPEGAPLQNAIILDKLTPT